MFWVAFFAHLSRSLLSLICLPHLICLPSFLLCKEKGKKGKAKTKSKRQQRRETRSARKQRQAEDNSGEGDLKELSEEHLDGEELADDPSESESEFKGTVGPTESERESERTADQTAAMFRPASASALDDRTAESRFEVMAVGKRCAGEKVR